MKLKIGWVLFTAIVAVCGLANGQPTEPTVTTLKIAVVPKSIIWPIILPPAPAPQPVLPNAQIKLNSTQRYILSSDQPLLVESYGIGKMTFTYRKGPVTLPITVAVGWKPDAGDKDFVTIPGPYVYFAKAEASGTATLRVQSAVCKLDAMGKPIPFTDKDVTRKEFILDAGIAPIPPPTPTPTPTPVPPPSPAPIPVDGFRVMVVYESSKMRDWPKEQVSVITSVKIREYLDKHAVKDANGKADVRFFDQDVPFTTDTKLWQDAMKRPRKSLPWIVISDGKTGTEEPLPVSVDETIKLLQKYGGN